MKDVWHRLTGAFINGERVPEDRVREKAVFASLNGKRYELAIRIETGKRTLPQNSKLHVLARLVAHETGDSLDDVKRRVTLEALGVEAGTRKTMILGREFLIVRPTSELSKPECSAVVDRLLDNCRFLEIQVPQDEHVEVMA